MKRLIIATLLALVSAASWAGPVTREALLAQATADEFGLLARSDFQEVQLEDGRQAFRAQNPGGKPLLVGLIGEPSSLEEARVMIGLNGDNGPAAMLMLSALSGAAAPEWTGATDWTLSTLIALAKANGGQQARQVGNKTIHVQMVPPNVVIWSYRAQRL